MPVDIEDPRTLLTPNCFDLGAKILYARFFLKGIHSDFAQRIYTHHLQVWNGFYEQKPLREGASAFVENFEKIITAIRDETFDFEKSPIPINIQGNVINGRHRLAAAIACQRPAMVDVYPNSAGFEVCDYPFLASRKLEPDAADAMASEYARICDKVYVATVFCDHSTEQILEPLRRFGKPLYWKRISLFGDAPFNLMRELYLDEEWVEGWQKGFPGARGKARCTLSGQQTIGVYLFECESLERVIECKKHLRSQFEAGQHALHINDTHEETMRLIGVLLNRNSIHFLNWSRFQGFSRFQSMLEEYRSFLRGKDPGSFCVDGSAILAAYGLRECRDLDFISHSDEAGPNDLVNNHNDELHHHIVHRDELLFNPENFFWHSGVKFVALDKIKAMKAKRNEPKDRRDISLIRRCEAGWKGRVARFLRRFSLTRSNNKDRMLRP